MEIPQRYNWLQAELERPLHRDSCKSPSSTWTDLAHPTRSYTEMQGNRIQSTRPSALGIYASTAWNAHTAKNTRLLESIQNNAARFVHRKYDWNTSVTALKQDLNWPTLLQRRKIHDLTMWYKIHFGLVNINSPPVVLPRPRNSQDRIYHELSFIQVQHRVACFEHTFYVRTIPLWNSLPVSPASATSLNCFQRLAATHCGSPQP